VDDEYDKILNLEGEAMFSHFALILGLYGHIMISCKDSWPGWSSNAKDVNILLAHRKA